MPDPAQEAQLQEDAVAILRLYGLEDVLTDEDDPRLWAAALVRHWPEPSGAQAAPDALRFGVGARAADGEAFATRSGMAAVATWCFERVDAGRLRVVPCAERPAASFMTWALGNSGSSQGNGAPSFLTDYLDVSRPSKGEDSALVHAGTLVAPRAGIGETRYWKRREDGGWEETDEVFSRWLA